MTLLERIEKWRGYKTYEVRLTFRYRDAPLFVKVRRSLRATSKESAIAYAIKSERGEVDSSYSSICVEVFQRKWVPGG